MTFSAASGEVVPQLKYAVCLCFQRANGLLMLSVLAYDDKYSIWMRGVAERSRGAFVVCRGRKSWIEAGDERMSSARGFG